MRYVQLCGLSVLGLAASIASTVHAACPATPTPTCKTAAVGGFSYSDSDIGPKDKLSFKLTKTQATTAADFGTPDTSTIYELCIYGDGDLVTSSTVTADGDCSDDACWEAKPKGWAYKDKAGVQGGITGIGLSGTEDGSDKAKIKLKGQGDNLPDLSLPLAEPIIVQLVASNGGCWGVPFTAEQVEQDTVKRRIKAKAKSKQFPTCSDSTRNGWESDVDCGGPCPGCGYQQLCGSNSDCLSGDCQDNACAPGCTDGVANGDETDTDCGGGTCPTCSYNDTCGNNADCSSNVCRSGLCKTKRVFVTSTGYNGDLGGLSGGDDKCNARAAAASLGGTWVAWLSTDTVDAIDRIADQEYRDMQDEFVFSGKSQITDTSLPSEGIEYNEFGTDHFNVTAWSGTLNNGSRASFHCGNWTNGVSGSGVLGQPNRPIDWSATGTSNCNTSQRLICFEQ